MECLSEKTLKKTFPEGIQDSSEPEDARMEIVLPQRLLDAVDKKAENSDEYSSRSELVREKLREVVENE